MGRSLSRLGVESLSAVPAGVRRPAFDRDALAPAIVHLGLGAFARAHLAAVNDAAGDAPWGIHGVSLRRPDVLRGAVCSACSPHASTMSRGLSSLLPVSTATHWSTIA